MEFWSPLDKIHMLAQLADVKEDQYRLLLTLSAIIELLVDKGIISQEELTNKMFELNDLTSPQQRPKA